MKRERKNDKKTLIRSEVENDHGWTYEQSQLCGICSVDIEKIINE